MKKYFICLLLLVVATVSAFSVTGKAKYVFYFIGDGMGINQVQGSEFYLKKNYGDSATLLFTHFPNTGLAKTYSKSNIITDSAAGGTALATGEKTKNGTIGMDYKHKYALESVAEKAKKKGTRVGVATSVSIDHATPASFYAHQPSRKMAYEIGTDLAKSGFDFFAGSDFVSPMNSKNPQARNLYDLVQDSAYVIARGLDDYKKSAASASKIILFQEAGKDKNSIPFAIDRKPEDLTLTQITESAIDFLHQGDKGFFVMIEGGKIDWSSHSNDVGTTFAEVIDLDNAIRKAYAFYEAHPDSTLIVVTADHETGGLALGMEGYELYPEQLFSQRISQSELSKAILNLNTSNGSISWSLIQNLLKEKLGFWNTVKISSEEEEELKDAYRDAYEQDGEKVKSEYSEDEELAALAIDILNKKVNAGWTTKSHSAAYVPVFAIGVGAELFNGLQDNTDIPKKIIEVAGY